MPNHMQENNTMHNLPKHLRHTLQHKLVAHDAATVRHKSTKLYMSSMALWIMPATSQRNLGKCKKYRGPGQISLSSLAALKERLGTKSGAPSTSQPNNTERGEVAVQGISATTLHNTPSGLGTRAPPPTNTQIPQIPQYQPHIPHSTWSRSSTRWFRGCSWALAASTTRPS